MAKRNQENVDDDLWIKTLKAEYATDEELVTAVDVPSKEIKMVEKRNSEFEDKKNEALRLLQNLQELDERYAEARARLHERMEA